MSLEDFANGTLTPTVEQLARSTILDLVLTGEIDPAKAEEMALAAGISPLDARPTNSLFDPMKEIAWDLIQSVVWIAHRDIDAVRDVSSPFLEHWMVWKRAGIGHVIGRAGRAFLGRDELSISAQADLHIALIDGRLVARGNPTGGGKRTEISRTAWADMKIFPGGAVRDFSDEDFHGFNEVTLARQHVTLIWPPLSIKDVKPAGRPSHVEPVRGEAARRRSIGIAQKHLSKEAAFLVNWFERFHGDLPNPPKAKTIEGLIREEHNRWKDSLKTPPEN